MEIWFRVMETHCATCVWTLSKFSQPVCWENSIFNTCNHIHLYSFILCLFLTCVSQNILTRLCDEWQTHEQKEHRSVELPRAGIRRLVVPTPPALLLGAQEVWRLRAPVERSAPECDSGSHPGKTEIWLFQCDPLMRERTCWTRCISLNSVWYFVFKSTGLQQSRPRPNRKDLRVLLVINQSHRSKRSVGSCPCFPSFDDTGHRLLGGGVPHGVRLWVWISDVATPRSQVAVKGRWDEMDRSYSGKICSCMSINSDRGKTQESV